MPRYELAGEYFWTIEISGKNVTTSTGTIGKSGHTRLKAAKSESEARGLYDELIAEKLEQGYLLTGAPPPTSPTKAKPAPVKPKAASARAKKAR